MKVSYIELSNLLTLEKEVDEINNKPLYYSLLLSKNN